MLKYLIILLSFMYFCTCLEVTAASIDKTKTPRKATDAKPLDKKQGYLLVKMDVEGVAPSLNVDRLKTSDGLFLEGNESAQLMDEEFIIKLKEVEKGFYIINLKPGLYQVTQVNVPFFNLPFRLDTSEDSIWRFSITQGRTNYIGTLFVDKERSSELVNVSLFNRIATDKQSIDNDLAELLSSAPLRNGTGVRDDFYQLLNKSNASR